MSGETNYRQRIETLEKDNAELKRRVANLEGANRVMNDRILSALETNHARLTTQQDMPQLDLRQSSGAVDNANL